MRGRGPRYADPCFFKAHRGWLCIPSPPPPWGACHSLMEMGGFPASALAVMADSLWGSASDSHGRSPEASFQLASSFMTTRLGGRATLVHPLFPWTPGTQAIRRTATSS